MAGSYQRSRPLILTADDDEMERFLQREVLEQAGFDIIEAKSGAAALQLFAECKPDLVLDAGGAVDDGATVAPVIRS